MQMSTATVPETNPPCSDYEYLWRFPGLPRTRSFRHKSRTLVSFRGKGARSCFRVKCSHRKSPAFSDAVYDSLLPVLEKNPRLLRHPARLLDWFVGKSPGIAAKRATMEVALPRGTSSLLRSSNYDASPGSTPMPIYIDVRSRDSDETATRGPEGSPDPAGTTTRVCQ